MVWWPIQCISWKIPLDFYFITDFIPLGKERHQKIKPSESELKTPKISLHEANNLSKYNSFKTELDAIYEQIEESKHIRRKCS